MKEITIRLNDFLFNSGILGFFKVLEKSDEEHLVEIDKNSIKVPKEVFTNFETKYINAMINEFEKDTRWSTIKTERANIENLDISESENAKILEEKYKFIKNSMESNSYKAGYEILKTKNIDENPYKYIELLKKEENVCTRKELILKIANHIEKYKEIYCMKDIIYTKINCFWSNVSFLNRQANKNDIKEEYKKVFVVPVLEYIEGERKSELTCIECGNFINKKEANAMSWINDVGVDINRKKSGFWNFKEDTYICPICNLIYSCIPLGFTMIGSNGIFINNNESFKALKQSNYDIKEENVKEENFEKLYRRMIHDFIHISEISNEKMTKYEPKNIQVIKRVGLKDNQKYEFNMITRDKIEMLKNTDKYFEGLTNTNFYQEALNNLIDGKKQFDLIARIFREERNIEAVRKLLYIQLNCIGGINVEERKERIEEMIQEGEKLKKYFYINNENQNKLKAYIFKLQGTLKANNVEEFMKLFTMFYGSLEKPMPNCKAIKVLLEEPEYFRLLGYSYIYGLEKIADKKEEK